MKCAVCESELVESGSCPQCESTALETSEVEGVLVEEATPTVMAPPPPPAAFVPPPAPASYDNAVLLYGSHAPAQPFLTYGRVSVGMTTFLCVITLGIYYLIWIYKNMKVYRALSGRAGANMEQLFWGLVIAIGVTVLFSWTVILSILLGIAIIVLQIMLTSQMLDDRIAIAERYGFVSQLPSKGYTLGILIAGLVSPYLIVTLLITLPLFIWYLVVFFRGHNVVVDGVAQAAQQA